MNRRQFLECTVGAASVAVLFPQIKVPDDKELASFKRGPVIFRAPLLKCDEANKNGHIYPRKVVEEMMAEWRGREVPGTIGFDNFSAKVMFSDLSHTVSDLRIEDGVLTGRITVLNTQKGKILTKLIHEQDIVYRTGGLGSVSEGWNCDGKYFGGIVQKGFRLVSVAAVPADKGA